MERPLEISRPRRPDELRVLIVEDDPRVREMLVRVAQAAEFHVLAVWSGEEAVRHNNQAPFQIVILDYHLPRMNGLETLQKLREKSSDLQAIVLTGYASIDVAKQAIHLDVVEFLTKPCQRGELERALDRALKRLAATTPKPSDLAPEQDTPTTAQTTQTIEEAERELIFQSLRRNNGNRAASARELGITRRTLHNKINAYQSQGFPIP
jgi:DNA-binding NtrC family response regulator